MIVDSHVHIGRSDKITLSLSLAQLKNSMEEYRIFQSVVIPNISSTDSCIERNKIMLKELADMKEDDRDYFIPYAWIDINHEGYLNHLKAIRNSIYGVKFHPSVSQVEVNDDKMAPLLNYCEDEELPMLVHCGRHPISHIRNVLEVSKKHRKMTFIAAHLGGNAFDLIEEAIDLCKHGNMKNVFLDTSTGRHPELLRKMIKTIGDERIIFGTDLPYTNMELNMKYIELCELSPREYRNIMSYNFMKRILKKL